MNKGKEKNKMAPFLAINEASKGKQSSESKETVASTYTSPSQDHNSDVHVVLILV